MKKVVVSSLISVFILILIAGGFIYLQKFRSESSSALEAVPSDVAWLLSCDPSSGDLRQLANTGFFNGADTTGVLREWKNALLKFDSVAVNTPEIRQIFKSNPLIVSGHVTSPRTFSTVYILNITGTNGATIMKLMQKLTGISDEANSRNYNGADIREFVRKDGTIAFAFVISKGIFIGSSTPYLVEDALRQQRSDKVKSPATGLENVLRDAQRKSVVAVRYEGFEKWVQTNLVHGTVNLSELQNLGEWTTLRLDIHANQLTLNGNTTVTDSTQFLKMFRDQQPVIRSINRHLLSRTAAFVSWGFSNGNMFFSDLGNLLDEGEAAEWEEMKTDSLRHQFSDFVKDEIALVVVKPINGQKEYQYLAMASLRNEDSCVKILKKLTAAVSAQTIPEERYNDAVIRMVPGQGLLPSLFGPLFSKINRFYYTVIDNTLLVTSQVSALRSYINDYRLGNFLSDDKRFTALEKPLPATSNLYFYCSIPQSERLFTSVAAPQWTSWLLKHSASLRSWNGFTMSVNSQSGVYKTTALLGYFQDTLSVPQNLWKQQVDSNLAAGPFMPGDGKLAFVQNRRNLLTAIGADGTIKWTKQLDSRILGEVISVNGTDSAYVFNTYSFIYMLGRDGSALRGFPVQLPAAASSGLAFAGADDVLSARMYIPCLNMKLMCYNLFGKAPQGYYPFRLRQVVRNTPVVLPMQKGILLRGENAAGYFISTTGAIIHTLRQDVYFAPGTNFIADTLSETGYAWLTPEGNYVKGGKDGIPVESVNITNGDTLTGAATIDLNGDGKSDWLFTFKTGLQGVTSDGVSLFVYTSDKPLLYPVVITAMGRTLFAATDENRIYVFNRNGSLYEGFPVSGSGKPVFSAASDRMINMVYLGENGSVQMMQFR